jgi:hypothetical protein
MRYMPAWLDKFRAAKDWPKWQTDLLALLTPLLEAEAVAERVDAGVALIALAQEDRALPVLLATAKAEPALVGAIAKALSFLPWAKQLDLFERLIALRPQPEDLNHIVSSFERSLDPKVISPLWQLAGQDFVKIESASTITNALSTAYLGDQFYRLDKVDPKIKQAVIKDAKERAAAGPDVQRLIALALLASYSHEDASAVADAILADTKTGLAMRHDAYQVALLCRKKLERQELAVSGLANPDPKLRRLALTALAMGLSRLRIVRGEDIYRNMDLDDSDVSSRHSSEPILPKAPKSLTVEMVRPLLNDPDGEAAAFAGYLLCLLQEPAGLEPLVRQWRRQDKKDDDWKRLVYRAVTSLGDDSNIRLLEEIYHSFPQEERHSDLREFYWTIRSLEGPNALKLRKQIRTEVGMENLR